MSMPKKSQITRTDSAQSSFETAWRRMIYPFSSQDARSSAFKTAEGFDAVTSADPFFYNQCIEFMDGIV